jgi:hypothetical protein
MGRPRPPAAEPSANDPPDEWAIRAAAPGPEAEGLSRFALATVFHRRDGYSKMNADKFDGGGAPGSRNFHRRRNAVVFLRYGRK